MTISDQTSFFAALSRVSETTTVEQLLGCIESAVLSLGFERYALVDRSGRSGVRCVHHNAPGTWPGSSAEAMERNPAVRRAMASPIPFMWDRQMYTDNGAEHVWSAQAAQGFGAGICAAYGAHDMRACIVVAANAEQLDLDAQTLFQFSGNLLLLAGASLEALERLQPRKSEPPTVKLRPRELECLHWVMQNKTAWEISVILGISERTVNQHLARARDELGVANTKVAAARAFQLDLLPLRFAT